MRNTVARLLLDLIIVSTLYLSITSLGCMK